MPATSLWEVVDAREVMRTDTSTKRNWKGSLRTRLAHDAGKRLLAYVHGQANTGNDTLESQVARCMHLQQVYDECARRVKKLLSTSQSEKRLLVGIVGVPGSGKTTAAREISERVENCTPLPMDGFHLAKSELELFADPERAFRMRGAAYTFAPERLAAKLAEVSSGVRKDVFTPSFDHAEGDPVERGICVRATDRTVIVEGNYLLVRDDGPWSRVGALLDEVWFLDADLESAMARLAERHVKASNGRRLFFPLRKRRVSLHFVHSRWRRRWGLLRI